MDPAVKKSLLFIIIISTVVIVYWLQKKHRNRKVWSKNWLLKKNTSLLQYVNTDILEEDPLTYTNFLRMNDATFNKLLRMIEHRITKQNTNMRESISARKRLQITLRYLASGDSFTSLGLIGLIHRTTVSQIVKETLEAIKLILGPIYLRTPNTAEEWRIIAKEFEDCWGFPNCVGAMDGKHIGFRPLRKDAVLYYNYKGFHSIVLLALVDAQKKFLAVDVGVNGRISDGGVLSRSKLNTALLNNELNFPPPEPLPGRRIKVPFVIVADNAFPLRINLIKPYIFKSLSKMQIHFNKCLSRARNVVENAFGILANRFRVLLGLIESQDPHFVELVTLVCCILHNFLIEEDPNRYLGSNAEEDENEEPAELVPLEPIDARNDSGIKVRLEYLKYCNKVPLFY
nr:PREDICTED: uncharacterized protein LOC109039719 [Bemisia tabaci]